MNTNLHQNQTIYVWLTYAETNPASVSKKLQEQFDSQEQKILVDSKGMEIHNVLITQGLDNSIPYMLVALKFYTTGTFQNVLDEVIGVD